jgi:hypothetical protein
MNFIRFNWILFWIFYFESVYIESRYVVPPHWSIPIHSDHCRGALDLIRSGRTRSSRTGSISELFWGVRWRSDGQKESEESSPWWIRVTVAGVGSTARGQTSARLRWALAKKERSTRFGMARRVQWRCLWRRLHPEQRGKGDWRAPRRRLALVLDARSILCSTWHGRRL